VTPEINSQLLREQCVVSDAQMAIAAMQYGAEIVSPRFDFHTRQIVCYIKYDGRRGLFPDLAGYSIPYATSEVQLGA
jgi:hypothetical protein